MLKTICFTWRGPKIPAGGPIESTDKARGKSEGCDTKDRRYGP